MLLFNTLTRKKEKLVPYKKNNISLYACGPTVYDYAHIGHFRAYIFVDVLRRALRYNGFKLHHVMNITDVGHLTDDADAGEDKVEKKAWLEGKSVWDIAKFYADDFFDAMSVLNVEKPETVCKATDNIAEMIKMVKQIKKNGYAYKTSDGIYFDTSKLDDYGKLARLDIDQLKEGARVEKNPEKKNLTDFALWKFSPAYDNASKGVPKAAKRQMEWNSPWGIGFPGWHIECTAMGVKYLGKNIDIHTGGIDHIPVHHTNEIAQAQGAFGKDIVNIWLHNEFILIDGEKMSKSKNNFYRLPDLQKKGLSPLALRYFFLQAHYRTHVNFTWKALASAQIGLDSLFNRIVGLRLQGASIKNQQVVLRPEGATQQWCCKFAKAINDDLNTAKGLAVLQDVLKDNKLGAEEKLALAFDFDKVLGLGLVDAKAVKTKLPAEIKKLAKERKQARKEKDFKKSDALRRKIEKAGFKVRDTNKGQIIKPR